MCRACPLSRARSDSVQQCQHRRAFFLERRCGTRKQFTRGRSSLGKGKHIQDQMFEGKHLECALVPGRHGEFSDSHLRRKSKVLQHPCHAHSAPPRSRRRRQGAHPTADRRSITFVQDRAHSRTSIVPSPISFLIEDAFQKGTSFLGKQ